MFSSITKLAYEFRTCGSLEEINLDNITTWSRGDMTFDHFGSNRIKYIYLPNWIDLVGTRDIFFNTIQGGIRFGKNCVSVAQMIRSRQPAQYFIIESEMVVNRSTLYVNASYFFVPDNLVNSYKISDLWSSVASSIHPISEFPVIFPNEPARMYEPW